MPQKRLDSGARWSASVYRLLLFLYPADFRLEYGHGMVDAFRDRWVTERAKAPRFVGVRVWLFAFRDLFSSVLSERSSQWRARFSGNQQPTVPRRRRAPESVSDLWRDVRHTLRGFARNPGFVVLAVTTAAVGIGSNTAIFSVVNSVLLQPLPYDEPERMFFLRETWAGGGWGPASYPNLVDWREQNHAFEHLVAYEWTSTSLREVGSPTRLRSVSAEANLFEMLRAQPLMGRTFAPGEDQPGEAPVVVLSYALWERMFGSDPRLLGHTVSLNGESHTVIGIMPAGFTFPAGGPQVDLWLPLRLPRNVRENRGAHGLAVVGRLADGVNPEEAQLQMSAIARGLEQMYPEDQGGGGIWIRPLHEEVVGEVRPLLFMLFGAVLLVLLIACANVGNMLLARATDRSREVALRAALGAGRGRLVRQFLTESLLLSCAGGALGILLAYSSLDLLLALGGAQIPRSASIQIDGSVLVFLICVALLAGVGFGLAPALFASNTDMQSGLGGTSGRGGASWRRRMFRDTLVVVEFALAFVLLLGAALLVRTLANLQRVDPGFETENLLTMRLSLTAEQYPGSSATDFYRDVLERVEALPGVVSAGMNSRLPLQGYSISGRFALDGVPWGEPGTEPYAQWRLLSPGYFETIGRQITRGREFTKADEATSQPVVIVSETLARRYYAGEDPIGKIIRMPTAPELFLDPEDRRLKIVGLAADVIDAGLHRQPRSIIYLPYRQIEQSDELLDMSLVVKTHLPTSSIVSSVRDAVHEVDPTQPVYMVKTMDQIVSESLSSKRFVSWLFGSFAVIALVLALVGIYGVISYLVAQRTNEFGIRVALGASPGAVLREVLGGGMLLVGIGLILGIAGAVGVTRTLSGMLFGVVATDIPTYVAASVLLSAVAIAACFLPARRAMRADPVEVLRHE